MPNEDRGLRREAVRHMFRADIDAANDSLHKYLGEFPKDALGHSLCAAVGFYHHISERMPEGPREMLAAVLLGKGIPFPATLRKTVELELGRARAYANPCQGPGVLALAIVEGIKRDYLAMVSQKWVESFECARKASAHAHNLLKIDPEAHDAYFVLGMTEYMLHRIPGILRPLTPIQGVHGDVQKAIRYCETAERTGNYFQEFARRLLVDLYLDEGRRPDALQQIRKLSEEFPGNRGIAKDLRKLSAGR